MRMFISIIFALIMTASITMFVVLAFMLIASMPNSWVLTAVGILFLIFVIVEVIDISQHIKRN